MMMTLLPCLGKCLAYLWSHLVNLEALQPDVFLLDLQYLAVVFTFSFWHKPIFAFGAHSLLIYDDCFHWIMIISLFGFHSYRLACWLLVFCMLNFFWGLNCNFTFLLWPFLVHSLIQQAQKFFTETNDSDGARNVCFCDLDCSLIPLTYLFQCCYTCTRKLNVHQGMLTSACETEKFWHRIEI